jgi:spectinomycin phosphotransferase
MLIAPPERDLWDLIGDDPTIADTYTVRTRTAVVPEAVEMYRLAWDLAEIAVYTSDFRRPHTDTEDTREAWANLGDYLQPARWER